MSKTDNMQASSPSIIDLVSSSSRGPFPRPFARSSRYNDCVEILSSTPSPHRLSPPLPSSTMSPTNKSDPGEGCSDFHNVYEQSQLQYQDDFAWGNDDAFLHFDPHLRDQNPYRTTYITGDKPICSDESDIRQDIYASKRRKSKTRKSASSDHSDASSSTKKKRKEKSTKVKGKQKVGYDPPFDEEWEAKLKESIVQDNALYLRILRYEVCYMPVQTVIYTDATNSPFISEYF